MRHALRTMFTTADNQTFDLWRVLGAGVTVWWCGLYSWAVVHGQAFDPATAAGAAAALLAGIAGALRIKAPTEPAA